MPNQYTEIDHSRSLKKNYPKLAREWHPKKNDIKPSEITHGTNKVVWWICPEGHEYDMPISSRTHSKRPQNCPYCFGQRIGYGNDLKSMYPKIAKEWHQIKNNKQPTDYRGHSGQKVWWVCSKGHDYEMRIYIWLFYQFKQGITGFYRKIVYCFNNTYSLLTNIVFCKTGD